MHQQKTNYGISEFHIYNQSFIIIAFIQINKMGKILTQPTQSRTQKLSLSEFYGMRESKNALYQSKISQKSSKQKILVKNIIPFTQDDHEISSYLAKLEYLGQHIQGENLHLPVFCQVKQSSQFCSDLRNLYVIKNNYLQIFYQDYDVKVKQQINVRKKEYEHFSQQEVWYMLYSITNGLRKFERFNMKSGNLTTQKIVLNQKGHLKIINQLTYPQIPQFQKMQSKNANSGMINFYAPQQLQNMGNSSMFGSSMRKKIHPNICQTFSLGIVILQISHFMKSIQSKLTEGQLIRPCKFYKKQDTQDYYKAQLEFYLVDNAIDPYQVKSMLSLSHIKNKFQTYKNFNFKLIISTIAFTLLKPFTDNKKETKFDYVQYTFTK